MTINKTTVAGAGLILLAAMVGGVLVGWWVFRSVDAQLLLQNQAATVRLPGAIPVSARILNDLDILIDGKISTTVPVDQIIEVPIRDTLLVQTSFDSKVPIKMTVPIRDTIAVDQIVRVEGKVGVEIFGRSWMLPVKGDVPIKANVPISIDVPVDQVVHLKFTAPTSVKLAQALQVPLKTHISTTIPIRSAMQVPVKSDLQAEVSVHQPLEAVIEHAELRLPLRSLGLNWRDTAPRPSAPPLAGPR